MLSLLFESVLTHRYLQAVHKKSAIVLIIKNRQTDTSDKNSYHLIAMVTALSLIF